ncbi:ORF101 [Ranid herpesvirus 1]|uniref:ORF101 n=1 Tax=Ranid herpesvirus 1 TaxID=85655 RepID=Q14VM9_9VIRU|nr:ORF101 [Ranid herpesvirus 1]ABG25797.1 ORF101 [Ranid herpesvirus 1]
MNTASAKWRAEGDRFLEKFRGCKLRIKGLRTNAYMEVCALADTQYVTRPQVVEDWNSCYLETSVNFMVVGRCAHRSVQNTRRPVVLLADSGRIYLYYKHKMWYAAYSLQHLLEEGVCNLNYADVFARRNAPPIGERRRFYSFHGMQDASPQQRILFHSMQLGYAGLWQPPLATTTCLFRPSTSPQR